MMVVHLLSANFPFIEKIMTFLQRNSQSSKNYKVLYESTLKTVKARREQGSSHQVRTHSYNHDCSSFIIFV